MTQQNILELARAGDANAIASLIDQHLQPQLDGVITSEESKVIEMLVNKFNLTVTEIT